MTSKIQHASNRELLAVLSKDEDSPQFDAVAAHLEICTDCRQRLSQLAGPPSIDREASELLREYEWCETDPNKTGLCSNAPFSAHVRLDFLSPPVHPEMLGRLGRYDIERLIGSGGMGVVFKAFDTELNRPVAIKALAPHLSHVGAARQRFEREAKAVAAVVHENVVAIHDVETEHEVSFLVMQYVAGESLQTRIDREGPLGPREILRIGIQASAGLAAAHAQGIIHRDIKPGNILLENGVERVLLTDFGLARTVDDASLTQTGIVSGTPSYMSPEQAQGIPADQRTDLFSLGAVLYFMATGHPPFCAERAMGILNRICHHQQKPLWQIAEEIPDELSVLVDQLLEKKPSKRPASADVVHAKMLSVLSKIQSPGNSLARQCRRMLMRYPLQIRRFGVQGILVVLVCLLLLATARLVQTNNLLRDMNQSLRYQTEQAKQRPVDDGAFPTEKRARLNEPLSGKLDSLQQLRISDQLQRCPSLPKV